MSPANMNVFKMTIQLFGRCVILFSLVKYSDADKTILTYVSIIPNLRFEFKQAKQWFRIQKNSSS